MPSLKNIRFSKNGDYGNRIFIANANKEPESFIKLKKIYIELKEKFPDQFLPIFCNDKHKYATIRFKIDDKFEKNDVYDLDYVIKKMSVKDKRDADKIYINCFLNDSKLITKAPPSDDGEELEFD